MLGIGAAKRLALEHLAGGKAPAHDQTPSLSTRVSEVVHCVLWCAQSNVNSDISHVALASVLLGENPSEEVDDYENYYYYYYYYE